jgi:polyferredoxin
VAAEQACSWACSFAADILRSGFKWLLWTSSGHPDRLKVPAFALSIIFLLSFFYLSVISLLSSNPQTFIYIQNPQQSIQKPEFKAFWAFLGSINPNKGLFDLLSPIKQQNGVLAQNG